MLNGHVTGGWLFAQLSYYFVYVILYNHMLSAWNLWYWFSPTVRTAAVSWVKVAHLETSTWSSKVCPPKVPFSFKRLSHLNLQSLLIIIPISLRNFNFDRTVVALHMKPMSELKCGCQLSDDGSLIAMIIRQGNIRHQSSLPSEPQTSRNKLAGWNKNSNVFHKF